MVRQQRAFRQWKFWAVLAFAAIAIVYSNSLSNEFHFDDFHTITDNPAVRSLSNIPAFFRDATLFSVQPSNRTYRPVVTTSLAIDYFLGHGYKPFWFHLSTLFWFLVLVALLARLYFTAMQRIRPESADSNALWAIAAATWFGLHPAMAETVNYVIQRGDIYCTLGCVAALILWIELPNTRRFGLYLVPLALALLSKPPAAVFPTLLLIWILFFDSSGTASQRWRKALTAILPSVLVVAALMIFESHMTPKSFVAAQLSAADYRITQPLVWLRYFAELFLPIHLNVDTDLNATSDLTPGILAGFAFVIALIIAIWTSARRRQAAPLAFGLLWFVITQLPTSLYVLSETENDHRMFFSFAGLILGIVWTIRLLTERLLTKPHRAWLPRALVIFGLITLAAYGYGAHVRNEVWHTEDSLWKDDAAKSPHNGRGLMIYGLTLMNHGDYLGAKAQFEDALNYTPNYSVLETNLAVVSSAMGNTAEADRHFARSLTLAPGDDTTHAFYGRYLLQQGRTQEAIAQLRTAVQLNPARDMQRSLLAAAMQQQRPAPPITPTTAADWINLSLAYSQAGRIDDSMAAAREALQLDPHAAAAWNNIAAGYEVKKQWDKAIDAANRALAINPSFQLAHNNLVWSQQQKALEAKPR